MRLSWRVVLLFLLTAAPARALEGPQYLGPKPKSPARRLVTLAPSLTETVLALGAGDRLVGVSRFDELPEVARLPRVGGFVDPSVERVLALRPELVLVQPAPGNRRPVEKLAALGIPVLALPMHSVAEVLQAIREVGRALGEAGRAEALVEEIESARRKVRERARAEEPVRVLFVYGFQPLVVAGEGSFAVELLEDAGGVNAAEGAASAFSVYSPERAVRARPEVVIDAADTAAGADRLASLPGLREARWVRVRSRALLHPGPQLARGIEELFSLLHPAGSDAGR